MPGCGSQHHECEPDFNNETKNRFKELHTKYFGVNSTSIDLSNENTVNHLRCMHTELLKTNYCSLDHSNEEQKKEIFQTLHNNCSE